MHPILLDAAGHRRRPVTVPGYHAGRPPRNQGRRYPADPPIIAVMCAAGAGPDGARADRRAMACGVADRGSARARRLQRWHVGVEDRANTHAAPRRLGLALSAGA